MTKFIPYSRQHIDQDDYFLVKKALKSDLITTGEFVKNFETKFGRYLKVPYVSVCSSGTAALHLAFGAIGLKKGDNIILPSINFVAAENICKLMGANIFYSDVDSNTGQVRYKDLLNCVKKYKIKKIKAIVVSYIGGNIFDLINYQKFKKKFKCFLVEDSCHALGSSYNFNRNKHKVGCCKHSDVSTFSFHPLKSITTGEGGAVTTNNKNLYDKIELLKNHGFDRKRQRKSKNEIIINKMVGFNYRLSDLNCALGISQLSKIDKFIKKRNQIFKRYYYNLKNCNELSLVQTAKNTITSNHLVLALIDFPKLKIGKQAFRNFLLKKKIVTQVHYFPFYAKLKNKKIQNNFKGTKEYFSKTISLPVYYDLKLRDVDLICKHIKFIISNFKK